MIAEPLKRILVLGAACIAFSAQPALGAIITYSDRATWQSATGGITGGENFQSFGSDTNFDNTTVALSDGMAIGTSGLIGVSDTNQIDVPAINLTFDNLSTDGSSYASVGVFSPGTEHVFISIATPISAFGADFVGINDNSLLTRIELFSGATLVDTILPIGLPCCTTQRFIGFAGDSGESITEMRFVFNDPSNDAFGIDNIEIAASAAIAEPGSLILFGLGFVGMAYARRRTQKV